MNIISASVSDTRNFASRVAKSTKQGDVFALIGTLGMGKTEFVRGFVTEYSSTVTVKSPSFSLVNTYTTPLMVIHHFDFYRLAAVDELFEIGFYEYLETPAVCIIEWADMFYDALPKHTQTVHFKDYGIEKRTITLTPYLSK